MKIQIEENLMVVRFERGEPLMTSLELLIDKEKIFGGCCWGIGAITDPQLAFYDVHRQQYIQQVFLGEYEMLSCHGNFSLKDEHSMAHLHVVLGRKDFSVIGGHLLDCTVAATVEFYIFRTKNPISRYFDKNTGLNLLRLKKL
jgi:predicted DNA-binding protein with PD1-like motif